MSGKGGIQEILDEGRARLGNGKPLRETMLQAQDPRGFLPPPVKDFWDKANATGLVGLPYEQTPIGRAMSMRGRPVAEQIAARTTADHPAMGFVASTAVGKLGKLPGSNSLDLPDAPTAEVMKKFGRVESVPLGKTRGTQPKMDWDKFNSGKHPEPLIKEFADRPIAVRREDGEYLIYDGHHRTVKALNDGRDKLEMYVVDAKRYAPESAGRRAAKESISTDELLRQLLGE